MDEFLSNTGYVAGTPYLTLADLAFMATASSIKVVLDQDFAAFPNITAWYEKLEKTDIPNYEKANGEGLKLFGPYVKNRMKQ